MAGKVAAAHMSFGEYGLIECSFVSPWVVFCNGEHMGTELRSPYLIYKCLLPGTGLQASLRFVAGSRPGRAA